MYKQDIWQALGRVYLTDYEIMQHGRKGNRNEKTELIKRRLFEDLWRRMKNCKETTYPFIKSKNSKFLQNDRKVKIKETEDINFSIMEVKDDGFIIYVNKNLSIEKKRTLIAHELGHTFLYNTDKLPIKPYFNRNRRSDLIKSSQSVAYKEEEGFVYEIGRHILIPTEILEKTVPNNPSLSAFFKACKIFLTTKDIMARRLFWDIYDWSKKINYWKDAILIFCPISKIRRNKYTMPRGNKEIFRGYFLKNFQLKERWQFIIPILKYSLNKQEKIINSETIKNLSWDKPFKFKGSEFIIEMKYIPHDYRIYIMIYPR